MAQSNSVQKTKRLAISVPVELLKRFKSHCALQEYSPSEVLVSCIEKILGPSPKVELKKEKSR